MIPPLSEDLRDATPAQLRAEVVRLRSVIADLLVPEIERLRRVEASAREAVASLLLQNPTHNHNHDDREDEA